MKPMLIVFVGVAVWLGMSGLVTRRVITSTDVRGFYTAAVVIKEGRGRELYDLETQFETQRRVISELMVKELTLPFFNPAALAALLSPLALVSFEAAWWVMWVVNLILVVGWSARMVREKMGRWVWTLALTGPVWINALLGQLAWVWTWVWYMAWKSLSLGEDRKAGWWLGALALKPNWLVLPFLVMLLKRRWGVVRGVVEMGLVVAAMSLAISGVWGVEKYIELNRQAGGWNGIYGIETASEATWRAWGVNVGGFVGSVIWLGGVAVSLALLGTIWRGEWVRDKNLDWRWATLIVVTILTNWHMGFHDLTVLLVAMFLAVRNLKSGQVWVWAGWILAGWLVVIGPKPTQMLSVVGFFGWSVARYWMGGRGR